MAKRKGSSGRWLREHFDDPFVRKAQAAGYRSRAWFKLEEIQEKYGVLRPGMTVVDLGAAPGSWSQYATQVLGKQGQVIAMDILDMEPLPGVTFIRGDFREDAVLDRLLQVIPESGVDLVMSDMAPNISGVGAIDQPRSMYLVELAADFARQVLRPGGSFLTKVFQGEGFEELLAVLRAAFGSVNAFKPKASRARSREVYLLARNYKL